jgi:SAM-dependent methyltransferase
MTQTMEPAVRSIIAPQYAEGSYFQDVNRHSADAKFKADNFIKIFSRFAKSSRCTIHSLADVGCGSGDVLKLIADSLSALGFKSVNYKGYDVSPHVRNISHPRIQYFYEDFCQSDESVDLVTLFDVVEHVPDTIEFLKSVSKRCKIIALHIPLDDSVNCALRNLFHSKLQDPGHVLVLDTAAALNLLAFSGLRVVDYEYTFGFLAPSARTTVLSKVLLPLRYLLAKISPWALSKTLGGVSLSVIALTPLADS